MSELPAQWAQSSIGDVAESMKNGVYKPADAYSEDGIACLRMYNVEGGKIVWKDIKRMRLSKEDFEMYRLLPGDLLVNRVNSRELVGKAAMIPEGLEPCVFESKNIRLRLLTKLVEPKFVAFKLLLDGSRHFANNAQQVVGMASISQPQLAAFPIPLPPQAEQKRIVAKIEELFSELEAGEESLRVARRQLGVYRQSLLKQAFEGKLTAQWRTQNPAQLESPAQLLARIQSARQARYEQQLKMWQKNPAGTKKPRTSKLSIALDEASRDSLPQLPHQWAWITLGEIADTTVGFAFPSKDFTSDGIRLLRGDNIEPRKLRWTNAAHWPEAAMDEFRELLVSEGDIILAMDRPVISSGLKVALAKAHDVPCLLVQRVARIIGSSGIENRFLLALIDQQRFINHCLGHQTGTQLPHISEGQIRAFPVPLCSFPEQQEIVRLLDEQFEVIERNEREIDAALQRSEALRQAILKKAFTGRLVPQSPADEPASVLLARIRAERADTTAPKPRRRNEFR